MVSNPCYASAFKVMYICYLESVCWQTVCWGLQGLPKSFGTYRNTHVYQHLQAELIDSFSLPAYSSSESCGTGAYSSIIWAHGSENQRKKMPCRKCLKKETKPWFILLFCMIFKKNLRSLDHFKVIKSFSFGQNGDVPQQVSSFQSDGAKPHKIPL